MRQVLKHINFKTVFYLVLSITTVLFLMPVPEQPADSLINDKVVHVIIFFGLSFLIDLAYREHKFLFTLALILTGYGLIVELLQGFSGYRTFSIFDLIADVGGIASYTVIKKTRLLKIPE